MLFRSVQNVCKPENTTRVSRFTLNFTDLGRSNFISAVAYFKQEFFFLVSSNFVSTKLDLNLDSELPLELDSY